jgi:hypothetical protein
MAFLNPLTLFYLFALPLPIIIHLLERRRIKKVPFPSIRILKKTEKGKSGFLKLKDLLLLITRTLIILFLVLGFAKPIKPQKGFTILDDSWDMMERSGSSTLFEKGKKIAEKISRENGYTIFLASGSSYRPEAIPTYKRFYLKSRIKNITFITNKARIPGINTIQVTGDGDEISVDSVWLEDPLPIPESTNSLYIGVKNHTDRPIRRTCTLIWNNDTTNFTIDLAPNSMNLISQDIRFSHPGIYVGLVDIGEDGLTINNRRYFVFEVTKKIKVRIVEGSSSFFIKKALNPAYFDISITKYPGPKKFDVTIFSDAPPQKVREASLVLFGDKLGSKPVGGFLNLEEINFSHPIFSIFKGDTRSDIKKIKFYKRYIPDSSMAPIARFSDGTPAIMELGPKTIYFNFFPDKASTDLVLSPNFVPLIFRTCGWLAKENIGRKNLVIGDIFRTGVSDASPYEILTPEGKEKVMPQTTRDGIFLTMAPESPGIYKIKGLTSFAANIAKESIPVTIPKNVKSGRNLSRIFFALCFLFFVLELIIRII